MPDTKSELNDIILNKSHNSFGGFKKVLLAVASFSVLLIVVVVVMSSINEKPANSLAKTILPPEPGITTNENSELFKSVDIDQEDSDSEQDRLESIANEIKQQTLKSNNLVKEDKQAVVKTDDSVITIDDPYEAVTQPLVKSKQAVKEVVVKKKVETKRITPIKKKTVQKEASKGHWYVQVGSFVKVKPSERLIAKIKRMGYEYKVYQSKVDGQPLTKLLIGPYISYKKAQQAKPKITREIESAAFIYKVVK